MEQYFIKIIRPADVAPWTTYTIEFDGFEVGKIKNNMEINIPTSEGNHILSVKLRGKVHKSIQINITENQYIKLKLTTWSMKIILEKLTEKQYINLPKKNIAPELIKKLAIAVIIFIIFTALLFPSTTLPDNNSAIQEVPAVTIDKTPEEKAQAELDKATTKFSNGDYKTALDICKNIENTYPDTDIAYNMNNYIKEQYNQYPHFTAKQLMAEYQANIVNADKEYTDKVMVISGTVSKIEKTNHDKNLCVLLKSGTYLWSVQLNFDVSQTDAVSSLHEGNSITAIGKCTGQSGKQLILFDGKNVMIENCLIV